MVRRMSTRALSTLLLLLALLATPARAEAPRRVYVGAYLTDVSDFDLKAGRFKADLRVWLKWLGSEEVPVLVFENAELDSKDELAREHDGDWHTVQYRVQGTFRGEFPVHDFPFDHQSLPVVFGLGHGEGELVPDLGASGMSPTFSITGWLYEPYFNARTSTRTLASDLGSITHEGRAAQLPRVAFTVELGRPTGPYFLKFVLPLSLILLMALLSLFLPAEKVDVRSAMGVTSLLSCIAFHYSQADTLPNVSYLVTADFFFLGAYSFVTATLLVSVLSFRLHLGRPDLAHRVDRFGLIGLPVVTVALLGLLLQASSPRAPAPVTPPPRASLPLLKVGATSLDTLASSGGPSRRSQAVVRGGDGHLKPVLVEVAPSMTSPMVRLLPDGGMRVRWRLLPQARWSDGRPVTTADVVFSLTSVVNPQRTAVDVVDEHTVDVTYAERRKEWLESLALYPRAALERVYADAGREAMTRAANEAGVPTAAAYRVQSYTAGQSLVLERNPHFGGPAPTFEKVEVVKVAPADAAAALLEHRVDLLPSLDAHTYEQLVHDERVRVLEQPGELLWVLVPNLEAPPWNALEARRALLAALDRDALARELRPEPAIAGSTWRPGVHPPAIPRYDPVGAATRLEALGLKGHHLQLHVGSQKDPESPAAHLAARLQTELTRAGFEVELVEHAELGPLVQQRTFEGLLLISRDTADGSRFLNVPFRGGHFEDDRVQGPHFDEPMRAAWERFSDSLYTERRAALEQTLQTLWAERLPMLPLVLTSRLAAVRRDLVGPEWGHADTLYWNVGDWRFEEPAHSTVRRSTP